MLTAALTICSSIWDIAVGTIVPVPWKYPRKTPKKAIPQTVGAKVRRATLE